MTSHSSNHFQLTQHLCLLFIAFCLEEFWKPLTSVGVNLNNTIHAEDEQSPGEEVSFCQHMLALFKIVHILLAPGGCLGVCTCSACVRVSVSVPAEVTHHSITMRRHFLPW